jgi:hypothetical protein
VFKLIASGTTHSPRGGSGGEGEYDPGTATSVASNTIGSASPTSRRHAHATRALAVLRSLASPLLLPPLLSAPAAVDAVGASSSS